MRHPEKEPCTNQFIIVIKIDSTNEHLIDFFFFLLLFLIVDIMLEWMVTKARTRAMRIKSEKRLLQA